MNMPIAYCEDGARSKALDQLHRTGKIQLISFPYEARSRFMNRAKPSKITCDSSYIKCSDDFFTIDSAESEMFQSIKAIIGNQNEFDARHIDSAYQSRAKCFFTRDKGDILFHKADLEALLGIKFFHPDDDFETFSLWLAEQA